MEYETLKCEYCSLMLNQNLCFFFAVVNIILAVLYQEMFHLL